MIKEASKKRQLLKAVRDIEQQIIKDELNISDMFELAEKKIFDVTQSAESREWQDVATVVDAEFKRIQSLMENKSEVFKLIK